MTWSRAIILQLSAVTPHQGASVHPAAFWHLCFELGHSLGAVGQEVLPSKAVPAHRSVAQTTAPTSGCLSVIGTETTPAPRARLQLAAAA